jgi:hypothetical protein
MSTLTKYVEKSINIKNIILVLLESPQSILYKFGIMNVYIFAMYLIKFYKV